jgi:hypothetical protein
MKRFWSTAAALLLALVGAAGLAAPASAAQGCTPGDGYWPEAVCSLAVTVTPSCTTDTQHLDYVASAQGTRLQTMSITWVNPGGDDIVLTDQPLSGSLVWPTAAWAQGTVEVAFHVNPTSVVTVTRPTGAGCQVTLASNTVSTSQALGSRILAATGSDAAPLVAGSAALLGLGVAALLVARRRRAGADA